ncbi:hypothetical protein TD95_001366 [Thielaviopsis punctulata]|uniref:Small-subunit processome Utp12 domain-containing protein n=1 Tax=Thielaviopsis punctulata TaxID=72032 RepID=A0A0F4ZHK9_9PEZI|nr:hypothetical protein TD95_001366 [Thielaviopsis punctulata]
MAGQTKRKAPSKIVAPRMQGSAKPVTRAAINESKTSVSTAENLKATKKREPETIELSSDAESNDDDIDSDEEMAEPAATAEAEDSDADAAAPTFGELVHNQETVDVTAALAGRPATTTADASAPAAAAAQSRTVTAPSLSSLSTVLTQALRTDDSELLESCLATANQATVRNTIERLDSALAGALLSKLAARIYRRPGRAGTLLQWVQWTLVAHGGALASQPEVMGKLTMLQKVLAERSRGLNSLLVLKGKLDLLESQMQLRKKMQSKESRRDGEDDEENVIWVEGEDDEAARRVAVDDDEEIDEVPTANGVMGDSDEEDDEEDLDDDEDDVDVEDLEEDDDDMDNSDGEDSGDDDESEAEAAPPAKMRKTGGGFTKSR